MIVRPVSVQRFYWSSRYKMNYHSQRELVHGFSMEKSTQASGRPGVDSLD